MGVIEMKHVEMLSCLSKIQIHFNLTTSLSLLKKCSDLLMLEGEEF